jgi:hypothetical protein
MFALDVFDEYHGFWNVTRALMMHLIPTWIVLGVLVVSWRWEWVGGALFTGLGGFYILQFWGRFSWGTYAVIAGPLVLLGGLFLANWLYRKRLRVAGA